VATLAPAQMSELVERMAGQGVLYDGLRIVGGGSILGGLILGAIAVFVIDREFAKAAGFALAGAVLTFFGFMHGEQIGIAQTPTVAAGYLIIAGLFLACGRLGVAVPAAEHPTHMPAAELEARV
jgi:AGZA family xanthine/uracil permease-like MFS transporter